MKDKKGSSIGVAAIVIVVVLLLAFVVPWTLSLVDTGPTSSRHHVLPYHPGSTYIMSGATPMTFYKQVDVDSVRTWLTWDEDSAVGICTVRMRFQTNNQVGGYAVVRFTSQSYSSGDWYLSYLGLPSGTQVLVPGDYLMAVTVMCNEPDQIWWWHEIYSLSMFDYDASIVVPEDYALLDANRNGLWDGERFYQNPAYVLEGELSGPDAPPMDPDDPVDPVDPQTEETPPLIDAALKKTGMNYEDLLLYVVLGAVVIIVMVAIVLMVKP